MMSANLSLVKHSLEKCSNMTHLKGKQIEIIPWQIYQSIVLKLDIT